MKAYQHELAHSYEHRRRLFQFSSASLFQSLITAIIVGVVVALVGVVIIKVSQTGQIPWYILASAEGIVQLLIVTVLLTILLEQRRKRSIRRTLELAFLNHHIRNAMTQMTMASNAADPEEQQRFMREATARVSEKLPGCLSKLISLERNWPTKAKRERRAMRDRRKNSLPIPTEPSKEFPRTSFSTPLVARL